MIEMHLYTQMGDMQKGYSSPPTIKKYKSAPDTQNYLILRVKGIRTGPVSLLESLQYLGGWSWCNGAARLYRLTRYTCSHCRFSLA